MKKIYLLLALAFLFAKSLRSQNLCSTPYDTVFSSFYGNIIVPEHFDSIFVKVYPIAVRDSNGNGGHPLSHIEQSLCILINDFAPYNIFFDIQPIGTLNNTQILNIENPANSFNITWSDFDILTYPFTNVDGITIFYISDPYDTLKSSWARSLTRSIYMGGSAVYHERHTGTSLITHEMGHIFGLHHTFLGGGRPSICGNFNPFPSNACAELVDGSNCSSCGDLICDTKADPGIMRETERTCSNPLYIYDSIITYDCNYNWDYINSYPLEQRRLYYLYDSIGDTLNPDMNNFMTYTYPRCMNYFSLEQVNFMRYIIDTVLIHEQSNQQNFTSNLDLVIRTALDDYGEEPYTKSTKLWKSPDIWVRNQPDGFQNQISQNPYFDSVNNNPVYVYVRVSNNSCENYLGGGFLKLYWAKAATALAWPVDWVNAFTNGIPYGDIVDSVQFSGISPWGEQIFQFEWYPEDPAQYIGLFPDKQPWHFCLLARIVAAEDPMSVPEVSSIHANVANNNNIGWRNVYLVYPPELSYFDPGGVIAIGSVEEDQEQTYTITFSTYSVNDQFITDEAEVSFILNEVTWQKWDEGGRLGDKIEIVDEENRRIRIIEDGAYLDGLTYQPMERSTLSLSFNFLVDELTNTEEFECDLIQTISGNDDEIIGGETYIITKDLNRIPFQADAGDDVLIPLGDNTVLEAQDIGEDAIYNWYINDTLRIHTGKEFIACPEQTETYKLEVIAKDGYKDYDSVKVQVKPFAITNINPNPAESMVSISYRIKQNSNAQLVILRSNGTEMFNQTLSSSNTSVSVNVSAFPTGTYTAVIRTGNQNADSKIFVVQ